MGNKIVNNLFILTGTLGSGKSTVMEELTNDGILTVDEPARSIIAEQRAINGDGLYDKDKKLFVELMLSRAICQHQESGKSEEVVVFDRGIPDLIGYAKIFNLNSAIVENAANIFKYNKNVIYFPPWKEIYTTDEDRNLSFEESEKFGNLIKEGYLSLGYNFDEVLIGEIAARKEFIKAGVPNWRLDKLSVLYKDLLNNDDFMSHYGLSIKQVEQLRDLQPKLDDAVKNGTLL